MRTRSNKSQKAQDEHHREHPEQNTSLKTSRACGGSGLGDQRKTDVRLASDSIGNITVDSAVAFADSLDYDTLNTLYTRIQTIVKEKAIDSILATSADKSLVANGVRIPPEILSRIYKYLEPEDIDSTRLVCKAMYCMARDKKSWYALPADVYEEGALLGPQTTLSEFITTLGRYPYLEHLGFGSREFSTMDDAIRLTAAIPDVTKLKFYDLSKIDQEQLDYIVDKLPLTWLAVPDLVPTDISSLVTLKIRPRTWYHHSDWHLNSASFPESRSKSLTHLSLPLTRITDNRILENCPNLKVLEVEEGNVFCPLVSASLKRLRVSSIHDTQGIAGLTSLDYLHVYSVQCSGVANSSMRVLHGHVYECERLRYHNLDWDNCTNINTQHLGRRSRLDFDRSSVCSPPVRELSAEHCEWIPNSVLPMVETLTLAPWHLPFERTVAGLEELASTSWVGNIQHFNIYLAEQCDASLDKVLEKMPKLRTLRIAGMSPTFSNTTVHPSLQELTLEITDTGYLDKGPDHEADGGDSAEDITWIFTEIQRAFPNLSILRLPANFADDIILDIAQDKYDWLSKFDWEFVLQVPLHEGYKVLETFELLENSSLVLVDYHLPLKKIWPDVTKWRFWLASD